MDVTILHISQLVSRCVCRIFLCCVDHIGKVFNVQVLGVYAQRYHFPSTNTLALRYVKPVHTIICNYYRVYVVFQLTLRITLPLRCV